MNTLVGLLIVLLAICVCAISYFLAKYLQANELRKYSESVALRLKAGNKEQEEDLDLLMVHLLHWVEFNREYRELFRAFLPAANNPAVLDAFTQLEGRYRRLFEITETDRKEYMKKLRQSDDYTAEFNTVITTLVERLAGLAGKSATETPILNDNREN